MTVGRPSLYSVELTDKICARIAQGRSLKSISDDDDMPGRDTIYRWLFSEKLFQDSYAHAREAQAEVLAQDLIDLADSCPSFSNEEIQKVKLQIETRKWVAAKLKPKKYGDATILRGDKDNPIEMTLATALQGLESKRLPASDKTLPVIDLVPVIDLKVDDFI